MTTLLEVRDLAVNYKHSITAVTGFDLTIQSGGSVAIIGANGAGKSSIMKALAGWHPVAQGYVRFDDEDITLLNPTNRARRGIGYIPEGGHIFQRLTVRENLLMGGYQVDNPSYQIKRACTPFPTLLEHQKQLAGTLSGGERQMLALARAIMSQPRLLLIDEMSIGLMPRAIDQIFKEIKNLVKQGTSVLLTEQNARKAIAAVDYVYVIENGRIVLSGPPEEIATDDRIATVYLGG